MGLSVAGSIPTGGSNLLLKLICQSPQNNTKMTTLSTLSNYEKVRISSWGNVIAWTTGGGGCICGCWMCVVVCTSVSSMGKMSHLLAVERVECTYNHPRAGLLYAKPNSSTSTSKKMTWCNYIEIFWLSGAWNSGLSPFKGTDRVHWLSGFDLPWSSSDFPISQPSHLSYIWK